MMLNLHILLLKKVFNLIKEDCFAYQPKKNIFTNTQDFYCSALNVVTCDKCKFYKKLDDFPKGHFWGIKK